MTDHDLIKDALCNLIVIERDRQLGYRESELHLDPKEALRQADKALEELGVDPEDVIWPDDREKLGL